MSTTTHGRRGAIDYPITERAMAPYTPSRAPPFPELDAARVCPPPPRHLATPRPPLHPARDAALRGPCSVSLAAVPSIGHVDGLGATELFDRLLPTMPWNTLIDTVMGELHARGKTLHDVAEVLRAAPIDPHVVAAIKAAYGLGCDLRVLCNAKRFFIETILDHHGLRGYFSEINTNPSRIDVDGRLRIAPHHDYHTGPHGCGLGTCPPNMCKGQVLDRTRVGISSKTLSAVATKTLSAAAGLGIGVC
nr:inorganic pyrophosphatase 1-like [Lolium perenne]